MGASPVALWVCDFHTKGLCSPENSTYVPGSFDLAARRRGRLVGKAGGDVCVGEGTRVGMRLQHGHGTSPGQQFLGSSGRAQHSSAPLALLPPPTSSPSSAAAHPQTSLFALQKYMEEVGSGAASKWSEAVVATRAECTQAAPPREVGYKATAAQAQLQELTACSLAVLPFPGPPVTGPRGSPHPLPHNQASFHRAAFLP